MTDAEYEAGFQAARTPIVHFQRRTDPYELMAQLNKDLKRAEEDLRHARHLLLSIIESAGGTVEVTARDLISADMNLSVVTEYHIGTHVLKITGRKS